MILGSGSGVWMKEGCGMACSSCRRYVCVCVCVCVCMCVCVCVCVCECVCVWCSDAAGAEKHQQDHTHTYNTRTTHTQKHNTSQTQTQETYCFPDTLLSQVLYPLPAPSSASAGDDRVCWQRAARALEVGALLRLLACIERSIEHD